MLLTRLLLGLLFIAAGTIHLLDPGGFLPIVPPFVPLPWTCILLSGVAEIAGGLFLCIAPAGPERIWTGRLLILLLIAVFPANIYMAVAHVRIHGFPRQEWLSWARLPLQPVLMALLWWATRKPAAP